MPYRRRILDDTIDHLLPQLAAISIDGPKAVGKTATATERATTVLHIDDPAVAELLLAAPDAIANYPAPVLLDEWQRMPQIWDRVRRAVDRDSRGGQFILTGSAVPMSAPVHTGAGRIVRLRMRPLSMAERGLETPTVSLSALLSNERDIQGSTQVSLQHYIEEIVGSGFPAIRTLSGDARRAQLDGYLDQIVQRDFPEMNQRVRRPQLLRSWMSAYAAATATTTSYARIGQTAIADGQTPSRDTTTSYREVLSHLWMLDQVPAWTPTHNAFTRVAASPKHFLADPALAARLLRLDEQRLLNAQYPDDFLPHDGTVLGNLFEALVALSLQTYAAANNSTLSHFRNSSGTREIDFLVHRGDEEVIAFEVKLSRTPTNAAVDHLLWLKEQLGDRLKDMVLINTGPNAYRRPDGVAVVPLALLGP